jgi:hypothetical protein
MAVAVDVGPDLDPLTDNPLDRKPAILNPRVDILDMEAAARNGTLDSLSCFIHGDAIDMETEDMETKDMETKIIETTLVEPRT